MQDSTERLTVGQAASRLGVSPDAVRKRIRRGTLDAYKVAGEWQIVVPIGLSTGQDALGETVPAIVQDAARDAIAYLESERDRLLRDNDRLLTTVTGLEETVRRQTETIAELARQVGERANPSPGPSPSTMETVSATVREASTAVTRRRSWWRRLLGQ